MLISGRVDGIVQAHVKVEIQANAIVTGEIHSPCLVIDPGAVFTGEFYLTTGSESSEPLLIPVRTACEPAEKLAEPSIVLRPRFACISLSRRWLERRR